MTSLPPFVARSLLSMCRRFMEREPDQVLGDGRSPYLERWFLDKTREGSVYVHRMLRSDADVELHCHPADSMSIVLDGEMREVMPDGTRVLRPGDVVVRDADDRHRIEIDAPMTTIFIMGERKAKEWGFHRTEADGKTTFIPSQDFFVQRGDQ